MYAYVEQEANWRRNSYWTRIMFGSSHVWTCKPNMKARKLQANPNIVQIAPHLTEICSVYMKARK